MSMNPELWRALGALAEKPAHEHQRLAALLELPATPSREAHTALFVLQLPPYASIYTGEDGMLGGVARDRVAGFWRALGITPPAEPDHLSALFGLYATLLDAEAHASDDVRTRMRHARRALFWEHLASWLVAYLPRVSEVGDEVYRAWATLARSALCAEAEGLGPPEVPPLVLRAATPRPELQSLAVTELAALLMTPVRCGIILTRSHLQRAARETGTAARVGERRHVLQHLFAQSPGEIIAWLRHEAARQAEVYDAERESLEAVASFWKRRVQQCAHALQNLSQAEAGSR